MSNPSFAYPTGVIPAKARTQGFAMPVLSRNLEKLSANSVLCGGVFNVRDPGLCESTISWVPAYAGMTPAWGAIFLAPCLRWGRNDDLGKER
ncbi:MAG: hypothetical protein H0X26_03640 [Alphaproteobacteria bacterium]|nr:hypothetical protein [Alphaproteobacteria bacterium]